MTTTFKLTRAEANYLARKQAQIVQTHADLRKAQSAVNDFANDVIASHGAKPGDYGEMKIEQRDGEFFLVPVGGAPTDGVANAS